MFRKYEKTFRILTPQIKIKGKHYLTSQQVDLLLAGRVDIEEKLDGANVGIIRHKEGIHLQKRGSLVGKSEHKQFQFFWNWAMYQNYNKLMELPQGYIVYAELLYAVHSIYYNRLLDWIVVYDVFDGKGFLNRKQKEKFCAKYDLVCSPLLYSGKATLESLFYFIPLKSAFGDFAEGIVVKQYKKNEYLKGKLVKDEFIKMMEDDHWLNKPLKVNKVVDKTKEME